MHHHFTNSERIALAVYSCLKRGGFVNSDFTDMESSKFRELGPTFVSSWGQIDRAVERIITFKTGEVFPSQPIAVKITLVGARITEGSRPNTRPNIGWRLQSIVLIFTDASQNQEVLLTLSYGDILTRTNEARQESKRCEVLSQLWNLATETQFPAEPENS